MIRVNLLATTPGAAPKRVFLPPEQRSALGGLALLFLTATGVGGWWWMLDGEQSAVNTSITQAEAEIDRLKGAAKLVDEMTARKAELAERLNLIERLKATERDPIMLLESVTRSLPDGLWLLDMKQAGQGVTIEGDALSLTYVTDFADRLKGSGNFTGPLDVDTRSDVVFETPVIRFTMKGQTVDRSKPATTTTTPAAPATKPAAPTTPAQASKGVANGG